MNWLRDLWANGPVMTFDRWIEMIWTSFAAIVLGFILVLIVGVLLATSAPAQETHTHVHKDGRTFEQRIGEFYDSWKRPTNRDDQGNRVGSCCNKNDCEPVTIIRKGGQLYARNHKLAPGQDVLIPENLIEANQPDGRDSPDGRNHVCLNYSGTALCAVLGSGQ